MIGIKIWLEGVRGRCELGLQDYDLEESGNLLANELMEIPMAAKNVA